MRRGRPTVHKAFDEATAILAGDGLQSLAFDVLADPATHADAGVRAALVAGLAAAAGAGGMVGGQMLDLTAATAASTPTAVARMQAMKTGALFRYAAEAGGSSAGAPEGEGRRSPATAPRSAPRSRSPTTCSTEGDGAAPARRRRKDAGGQGDAGLAPRRRRRARGPRRNGRRGDGPELRPFGEARHGAHRRRAVGGGRGGVGISGAWT